MRSVFPGKIVLLVGTFFAMSACEKKETLTIDSESQSSVDHVIADQEFMSLPAIIYQHLSRNTSAGGAGNPIRNCAPFKFEGGDTLHAGEPVSYSLNMAETTCSLADGKERKGTVYLTLSGYLNAPGSRMVVKLRDYLAGEWRYSCDSMILISAGVSGAYNAYKADVYGGLVTRDEQVIRYNCSRKVAVYSDQKAPGKSATTTFFGTTEGVNRVGLAFKTEVKTDISKPNDCSFFNAGTLIIIPTGYKDRLIDFGAGECDDLGSFTVDENTVAFKLK